MRKTKFVILIVAICILVPLAAFGAVEFTSRPPFCNSCHEMNPMYNAWASSAHKSVNCIKCHANPGPVGLIEAKLGAAKDVYYHITGTYKKPIESKAAKIDFNKRCLVCHSQIIGKSDPHNKAHFNNGLACIDCHDNLVHNPKANKNPPSRAVCKNCHQ